MPIMRTLGDPQRKTLRRDLFVALLCGAFVALLGGLSYAALPFYSCLCRAGGFPGTTEVAGALPSRQPPRLVSVRFDSDLAAPLPWSLRPPRNTVDAKLGRLVTVSSRFANGPGRISVGHASETASSPMAGLYFEKINCVCCAPQIMQPGESRDIAVVFYVDPKLADDFDQDGTITLFHTVYPVYAPVAAGERARPPGSGRARLPGRI
jgi:cytochrome c oxidase assembly protein subunit 11